MGSHIPDQAGNPLNIEPTGNLIENNYIGIDAAGTKALGNGASGVYDAGSGNTYGGTTAGLGNVISGNKAGGLKAGGSITIEGNYIGTDATGNVALGNRGLSGIDTSQDIGGAPVLSTSSRTTWSRATFGRGSTWTQSSQESQATYTIANNLDRDQRRRDRGAWGTAVLGSWSRRIRERLDPGQRDLRECRGLGVLAVHRPGAARTWSRET